MNSWWTAVRLLTCLPTPRLRGTTPDTLVGALIWFPVVGGVLGALLGLAELGVRQATANGALSCGVAAALGLLLTRGATLHGLMVVVGALFSARDRQQLTEMAVRPTPSAFGLLLGMAAVLLRYALLLGVPAPLRLGALLLGGALSRGGIVFVCWRFRYAGLDTGIGSYFGSLAGPRDLLLLLPLLAVGFGLLGPIAAGAAVVAAWLLTQGFASWVAHQVGGLTAQAYHAVAEVGELAAVAAVAGLTLLPGTL